MIWRDRLPKAPLDPTKVQKETGVGDVYDWIRLFNGFQAELPEPFATIEVLDGPFTNIACEALRALRRRPLIVHSAEIDFISNRMWNVNPVLSLISELTIPGTALDLGCGAGRDAVWLAANGWEVTGVDRLKNNIDTLRKLRMAYAPNDPVQWVVANIHEYQPASDYDLVLLHYCWDPAYFETAKRAVRKGGFLSVLAHSETHRQCFGHPRASKVLNPRNLTIDGFEPIINEQRWAIDRHFVSVVLQRD